MLLKILFHPWGGGWGVYQVCRGRISEGQGSIKNIMYNVEIINAVGKISSGVKLGYILYISIISPLPTFSTYFFSSATGGTKIIEFLDLKDAFLSRFSPFPPGTFHIKSASTWKSLSLI